jgi:hypothetical protein
MLGACSASGLAYLDAASHLCVHPAFGTWFALRALVVVDAEGPGPVLVRQLPCPFTPEQQQQIEQRVAELEVRRRCPAAAAAQLPLLRSCRCCCPAATAAAAAAAQLPPLLPSCRPGPPRAPPQPPPAACLPSA